MTAIRILLAGIFVFSICLATGQLLFRAIHMTLREYERVFLGFITGTALISNLVFVLAVCRMVYTSVLISTGGLILVAWLYFCRPSFRPTKPARADLSTGWLILFWIPYLAFGGMYLLAAMLPETSPDGTVYHLGLISRYYDHRGFLYPTTDMLAGFSAGIEMLFWIGFAIGRHSAAAVVHLLFLLTLPFGMLGFARRIKAPRAGVIGALLFYLAPVVGKDATCAYIDAATAAVVFSAFYFLEIWRSDINRRALIPAGLMAGFAYACKFTAGIVAVYAVLFVITVSYTRRIRWRDSLRMAGLTGLLAFAVAAPWLLKNVIQFQNPFFPLFNHWFPNPFQYPIVEDEWRNFMEHMSSVTYAQIPWQVTVGGKLIGIIGPIFLLSPLALVSLRSRAGRQLLVAFLFVFLPYFGNIGARFLIPALPFLSIALALGILSIPRIGTALAVLAVLLHSFLSWPTLINRWAPGYQWRVDDPDWAAAFRILPEKQFLEKHWRDYKAGLLLDQFVPAGDRVFSPGMGQLAYQHRDVIGTFESSLARRVFLTFLLPTFPALGSTWRREFQFRPMMAKKIRLVADTAWTSDLRVSEVRFYCNDADLRRESRWRLTASSNPWEVQLAFDNSPTSWWTSGQRVTPGAWLQTDFGESVQLDRIVLDQNADQRWINMHVATQVNGEWRPLHARQTGVEFPALPDLRMQVRDELKAIGIRWILIPDEHFGAEDLRKKSPYWGITQVAEANGFRLWKLN